ncbi:MAG TPA: hypothetical protein DCE74_09800 [Porphyromonadaceae bacterium]|nr:hypothetical protein [Porphyromonadaceae bacterium]
MFRCILSKIFHIVYYVITQLRHKKGIPLFPLQINKVINKFLNETTYFVPVKIFFQRETPSR